MIETQFRIEGSPSLALVGDIHNHTFNYIISKIEKHKPDFIMIVGDVVYGDYSDGDISPLICQKNVMPFLSSISKIAPTFLSLGNHEYGLDENDCLAIKIKTGIEILDNRYVIINRGKKKNVIIGGLTSGYVLDYRRVNSNRKMKRYPKRYDPRSPSDIAPDTSWLNLFASHQGYHILLSHHPEYYSLIPESIELILSAHVHGGQWRLYNPFKKEWIGLYSREQGLFPKYTKGIYYGRMIVTSGIANTAHFPRLFNPAEIVFINC